MSNYTKSTNFATKDTLTSGDPLKIVKGTEINTEFDNIATAVNSKSDTASPTFTGTVTIPILSYAGTTLSAAVTGTGKMVLDTSPTLVTPALGTPASGVLTNCTGVQYTGFKNRIINGAMVIDQRNAGASVTPSSNTYLVDRWYYQATQASKFSIQQNKGSVTLPTGFSNYLGLSTASAVTVGASDYFTVLQPIEGFNTADLGFGTASAATVTLSFRVYSSLTGTFGGALQNNGASRSYPFTYTISSANTWTTVSVTIAGDTSGTWVGATNGVGMYVLFGLGSGSSYSGTAGAWGSANYQTATGAVSVVGTLNATFYITGVQLEKGSTATSFDYRPYGTELQLAQRYYWRNTAGAAYTTYGSGLIATTTTANVVVNFPVSMRIAPTFSQSATAVFDGSTNSVFSAFGTSYIGLQTANIAFTGLSGMVLGRACYWSANNNSASYIDASSEL
jgi:hypothetical protein